MEIFYPDIDDETAEFPASPPATQPQESMDALEAAIVAKACKVSSLKNELFHEERELEALIGLLTAPGIRGLGQTGQLNPNLTP